MPECYVHLRRDITYYIRDNLYLYRTIRERLLKPFVTAQTLQRYIRQVKECGHHMAMRNVIRRLGTEGRRLPAEETGRRPPSFPEALRCRLGGYFPASLLHIQLQSRGCEVASYLAPFFYNSNLQIGQQIAHEFN